MHLRSLFRIERKNFAFMEKNVIMFYVQDKASGKNINASDEYVFIFYSLG